MTQIAQNGLDSRCVVQKIDGKRRLGQRANASC